MAYVLTSLSGNLISAASAAYAPTNSGDVSAIASAYADSAVSGKQDSGNYISAKGLTQTISNADSSLQVSFGSDNETAYGSKVAGLFITGSFSTAYYKDNELNLNRNNMKIAFNIGGQGPKITSMATGTRHPYMYLFASGKNSAVYSDTGIEFKDSGDNTVALYDSSTYDDITSVYDTVSANSATWGQGGADSSAMSAIASSYAESAEANCWPLSASDIVRSTGNGFIISYGNASFTVSPIAGGSTNPGYLKYQYAGWPTADFGLSNSAVYGGNTSLGTSYYFLLTKSGISGRYLSGNPASAFYWQYTKDEYDNLTSVTDTVSSNSASWAGGGGSDPFPYVIQSGTNQRAVLLTAFQDNNANRPTFMVSGYKSSNGKWPRMMVTDYNGSTGYTHSGVLLANAYETYIGTALAGESGVKTFRMDEYSMDFLPFRVWNTSTQSWYTEDLEKSYYHTAKYSRLGVTLSALENSGENELFNQFLNSGIYMSSTDYAYLDTADTASGMSATASASAEINIDSINSWNGKLDTSAIECTTASAITAIGGSAIAVGGGGGVVTSVSTIVDGWGDTDVNEINGYPVSAKIAKYDDMGNEIAMTYQRYSGMSAYLPFSAISADANSAITSINGSSIGGGGGSPIVVTGTAWDPDTSAYVYPTSNLSAAERHVWEWQNGSKSAYIEYLKDDSGNRFPMMAYVLAAGAEQMYRGKNDANGRLQFSPSQTMFSADGSNKYGLSPLTYATGASMNLSAGYFRASYRGDTIFISRGPTGTIDSSNSAQIKAVRIETHNSRGSNISAYDASTTGYYGTTAMKLSRSGVFVDDSGNSSNTASYVTLTTGSLMFNSAGSSDSMKQSSIPYWNAKMDSTAIQSAYASASATQATANGVLYILLPDGA